MYYVLGNLCYKIRTNSDSSLVSFQNLSLFYIISRL